MSSLLLLNKRPVEPQNTETTAPQDLLNKCMDQTVKHKPQLRNQSKRRAELKPGLMMQIVPLCFLTF